MVSFETLRPASRTASREQTPRQFAVLLVSLPEHFEHGILELVARALGQLEAETAPHQHDPLGRFLGGMAHSQEVHGQPPPALIKRSEHQHRVGVVGQLVRALEVVYVVPWPAASGGVEYLTSD